MTTSEFAKIMAFLGAVFNVELNKAKLDAYYTLLGEIDKLVLEQACRNLSLARKYPTFPNPGEIMEFVDQIIYANELSEGDAWEEVKRLVRKYGHYNKDNALSEMTPLVKKTIEQFGWVDVCMSTEPEGVLRGQFLKIYNINKTRQHEINKMNPEFLKELQAKKLFELEG